jgi:precorrin-2 dehydrogenase / sirohydrochlorin ferrochelatase
LYPVFLDIRGKLCVVVGGGRVARRKVKGLLAAGAAVRVISPKVGSQLAVLVDEGKIEWVSRTYAEGDLHDAFLVFAATDDRRTQELICRHAAADQQLVNVADDPGRCNFYVPSLFRRGDLTIAVSTSGKSPAVAALIRKELENSFGPEYVVLLEIMAQVRQQLGTEENTQAERKKIYKKILGDDILHWIKTRKMEKVRAHLEKVLEGRAVPDLGKTGLENE